MTIACRPLAILLLCLLPIVGCRQQQQSATDIQLSITASDLLVGETMLLVKATDRNGDTLTNPGTLTVRGDMQHAGMIPVLAESASAIDGVFTLPFEWTMGGAWIVEASLALPDGAVATETFHYQILNEASDANLADMDHNSIQQDELVDMPGGSSAVYMRISNRGESDITIVSASSPAAEHIAFHQTVVENDMARMEAVDGLLIPVGETVELAPGGAHIMLMGLTDDLLPDSQIPLQLHCDNGEIYNLGISVMNMLMNDLNDDVQVGDLVFSNRWARPARAGLMERASMDMRATPSG